SRSTWLAARGFSRCDRPCGSSPIPSCSPTRSLRTINGTAAMIFAMYVACADKQGVPRAKLTGTIQNDILKEYVARGTWIFPVRPSMRLIADTVLFANQVAP
ncbi:hypothetical protein F1714_12005, partial [Streptococcus pneumoniae]